MSSAKWRTFCPGSDELYNNHDTYADIVYIVSALGFLHLICDISKVLVARDICYCIIRDEKWYLIFQ